MQCTMTQELALRQGEDERAETLWKSERATQVERHSEMSSNAGTSLAAEQPRTQKRFKYSRLPDRLIRALEALSPVQSAGEP